jgi:hypothetical protein
MLQYIYQEMKVLERKILQEYLSRRKEQYFRKYSPEYFVPENPDSLMSVRTARSHVRTQLVVSLCSQYVRNFDSSTDASHNKVLFSHISRQPIDTSSKKSLFYIMSGHRRQDSGLKKVFHTDVRTLRQCVQTRFTESLLSDTCLNTTA